MLNKTAISVLYLNYNYKKMKLINSPSRGVETARYRIRKKLAIPGNINLVDFLIDFT